jgi:hypothetical protein
MNLTPSKFVLCVCDMNHVNEFLGSNLWRSSFVFFYNVLWFYHMSHMNFFFCFLIPILVLCLESARRACATICTHSRGGGGGGGGERDK